MGKKTIKSIHSFKALNDIFEMWLWADTVPTTLEKLSQNEDILATGGTSATSSPSEVLCVSKVAPSPASNVRSGPCRGSTARSKRARRLERTNTAPVKSDLSHMEGAASLELFQR